MNQLTKFLVSGFSAAATEYLTFLLLTLILRNDLIIISQSISFMCGFAVSFLLNRDWVFTSKGSRKVELFKYSALAMINIVLSNVIIWFLVIQHNASPWIAKLFIMALIATWNYFVFKHLIFSRRT